MDNETENRRDALKKIGLALAAASAGEPVIQAAAAQGPGDWALESPTVHSEHLMSFTLKVQFTGLCAHVVHPKEPWVAVLMPDGRFHGAAKRHPDGTPAVPHVGYLRVDLANVMGISSGARLQKGQRPGNQRGTFDGPFFEILHRFGNLGHPLGGGQTLDFGLPPDSSAPVVNIKLPRIDHVARNIPLRPDLFTKQAGAVAKSPPETSERSPLLFRTLLRGGTLETMPGAPTETWSIDRRLNQDPGVPIVAPFSGEVLWTRRVEGTNQMTITLTDFDGSNEVKVPLTAVDGEINLKIANLCAENPLEWDDFHIRTASNEDSDYKWFYQLLDPPAKGLSPTPDIMQRWRDLLDGDLLPAPHLVTQPAQRMGGRPPFDCAGTEISSSFPPFEAWST